MRDNSKSMDVLRVVAIASRTGRYGGPFDTATRQTYALRESGLNTQMLAGMFDGDQPTVEALAPGRYVRVRQMLPGRFTSAFSFRIALAVVLEVRKSATVHISFAREPLPVWAALVSILLRRRLVLQPHGMLTSRVTVGHRIADLICIRPLFRRASSIIALSSTEAQDLTRWNAGRTLPLHTVGNPLPPALPLVFTAREAPRPDVARVIFIARLHPRKHVDDFLQAAAEAQRGGKPWRWVVVGPDDGEEYLVRRAIDTNGMLHYQGAVSASGVVDQLSGASIFVMPSEHEPWGNVLASAIAMGIPSVVTRSAALAPQIEAYGAGRAVPDGDPLRLLAAVDELLAAEAYTEASEGALRLRRTLLDPEALRRGLVEAVSADR